MHPRMIYQTDETRKRILDTALTMFLENGLFATSMLDLAQKLELSRTSLYRYFRDKNHLATTLVSEILQNLHKDWLTINQDLLASMNGISALEHYLKNFWLAHEYRHYWYYLAEYDAFFSGVRLTKNVQVEMHDLIQEEGLSLAVSIIQRGIEDTSIRTPRSVHLCAVTIINSVRSLQQRIMLRKSVLVELYDGEAELLNMELVEYLLRGIRS